MSKSTTKITAETEPAGIIDERQAYSIGELMRRLGLGKSSLREARKNGLTLRRLGTRSFVLGRDVIAFLEKCRVVE